MPEFKPTVATGYVDKNGAVFDVCDIQGGVGFKPLERVPCLILPLWRPIAECPEEWKDARWVWLFDKGRGRWIEGWWSKANEGGWVVLSANLGPFTHVMLPPPDPQGEEVKP